MAHTEKELVEGVDGFDVLTLLAEEGEIGEDDARLCRLHLILVVANTREERCEDSRSRQVYQLTLGPGLGRYLFLLFQDQASAVGREDEVLLIVELVLQVGAVRIQWFLCNPHKKM
jgi:hypothetical protein